MQVQRIHHRRNVAAPTQQADLAARHGFCNPIDELMILGLNTRAYQQAGGRDTAGAQNRQRLQQVVANLAEPAPAAPRLVQRVRVAHRGDSPLGE